MRTLFPKRLVIDICVAVAAGGVAWMVLARPAAERLEAVRAEFQSQRERIARLLAEETGGKDPGRLVAEAEAERARLQNTLAGGSRGGLHAAAERTGVHLGETRSASRRGQVVQRGAAVEGGYDQVVDFIREIEQRMGASVVDRVEVTPSEQRGGTVRATLETRHVGGAEGQASDAGGSP